MFFPYVVVESHSAMPHTASRQLPHPVVALVADARSVTLVAPVRHAVTS
jgi:hypothetical protein